MSTEQIKLPDDPIMLCPHCDKGTLFSKLNRIEYDRTESGIIDQGKTKWQCPHCEMMVHDYDYEVNDES